MDVVDMANEHVEAQLAKAILAARGIPVLDLRRPSPGSCPDCHEPLPDHRRSVGICVPCLELREARGRFGR